MRTINRKPNSTILKPNEIKVCVNNKTYSELAEWVKHIPSRDLIFHISENYKETITRGSHHTMSLYGIDKKISQSAYEKMVKNHMAEYKRELFPGLPDGTYHRNLKKTYPHILPLADKREQEDVVRKYNTFNNIEENNDFLLSSNLHRLAHHLNSSQMMCYNFFRPYIHGKETPDKDLFSILQMSGLDIPYSDDAVCLFEYEQEDKEWLGEHAGVSKGTNFDFYLRTQNTEVFFEIKYTENGFGTFAKNDIVRHERKYNDFYAQKIQQCPALKKKVEFGESFRQNYQLIRNAIRVTDKSKYVVFLYDANNPKTYDHLHTFLSEYVADDYRQNIIPMEWQKLVLSSHPDKVYDFWLKYLSYLTC